MEEQLRIYTIKPGEMGEWVAEWREKIAPLRERHGFKVLGGWVDEAENRFIWLLEYRGDRSWEAADRAYYDSPDRTAMQPDPARHIARSETCFVTREWRQS